MKAEQRTCTHTTIESPPLRATQRAARNFALHTGCRGHTAARRAGDYYFLRHFLDRFSVTRNQTKHIRDEQLSLTTPDFLCYLYGMRQAAPRSPSSASTLLSASGPPSHNGKGLGVRAPDATSEQKTISDGTKLPLVVHPPQNHHIWYYCSTIRPAPGSLSHKDQTNHAQ